MVVSAPPSRVVELACLAPSVQNTQPWRWEIAHQSIELYSDEHRRLPVTDPEGRSLVISCGAALHHAQVAARALGWAPSVTRLPDGPDGDLLARVVLEPRASGADARASARGAGAPVHRPPPFHLVADPARPGPDPRLDRQRGRWRRHRVDRAHGAHPGRAPGQPCHRTPARRPRGRHGAAHVGRPRSGGRDPGRGGPSGREARRTEPIEF